jgi:hypothetical protein
MRLKSIKLIAPIALFALAMTPQAADPAAGASILDEKVPSLVSIFKASQNQPGVTTVASLLMDVQRNLTKIYPSRKPLKFFIEPEIAALQAKTPTEEEFGSVLKGTSVAECLKFFANVMRFDMSIDREKGYVLLSRTRGK